MQDAATLDGGGWTMEDAMEQREQSGPRFKVPNVETTNPVGTDH